MPKILVVLLLCLLVLPAAVFAQEPLWDLSQVVDVESLGIRFNAPDGWTVVETQVGIALVENEADVEAVSDDDSDTNPEGYAIAVSGLPMEDMGISDFSLEEIGDLIAEQTQVEVSESDVLTVNIRPARYIGGVSSDDGKGGYVAFWKQDGNLMTFVMALPDDELNVDAAFSFGTMLGTIRPIVSEDITSADEPYEITDLAISMTYPDGWATADAADTMGAPGAVFAENEDDIAAAAPEGTIIVAFQVEGTLEELGLEEDAEPEAVVEQFATAIGISDVEPQGEFVIAGQAGFGMTGTISATDGLGYLIVTRNADDGVFNIYGLFTPDEDALEEYTPVFLTMLWSVQPLED